jgi:hypothetical protein
MSDVDLSWMNVPGPDGRTWAQNNVAGAPALSAEQQKSWYELTGILKNFGLEGMNNRVKQYIIDNGTEDTTRIRLWLMEQPEFKERFPAMEKLSKEGRAISPEQYIQTEQQYIGVMRSAGLNPEFFDEDPSKPGVQFHKLIENEVLPEEFRTRVQDGFNRVANVNPLVRDAFKNYFGVEGDQALAAFFIDAEKAAPALTKAVAAAEMGAAAKAQDLNIDLNYATKLAEQGVSFAQAQEGMARVSQLSALFQTGVGESNIVSGGVAKSNLGTQLNTNRDSSNMSVKDQLGVDYIFGTDTKVQRELQTRLAQRKAETSGISQQTSVDRQGKTSIGTAN